MAYNLFQTDKQQNYPGVVQPTQQGQTFGQDKAMYYPSANGVAAQPQPTGDTRTTAQQPVVNTAAPVQQQVQPVQKPIDPNSDTDGINAISSMFTSPEEEERLRKSSVARQRIMAVGDALRHIGNIYNTVNYATPQKFNSPVEEERKRYINEKALRDAQNLKYASYQQAKAKMDAQQRQWEADYGLKMADAARRAGYTEAQIKNMQDRLAEQKGYHDATIGLNKKKWDDQTKRWERQDAETANYHRQIVADRNRRTNIYETKVNSSGKGGGGSKVAPLVTYRGTVYPSGASYANQLKQMWSYAKERGLVNESEVAKALAEAGFGKETPDNVKAQKVLSLIRTNPEMADYAINNFKWSSAPDNNMNLGLDSDDDDMNLGLE